MARSVTRGLWIPGSAQSRGFERGRLIRSALEIGAAVGVGAVAAVAALSSIKDGLWADELWSLGVARIPAGQFWSTFVWGPESNAVLYHAVLRGWLSVAGDLGMPSTEWVVRAPSALFAVAAALAVLAYGRRLSANPVVGIVAALVFAINPFVLDSAGNDAVSYSLALPLEIVSWLALTAMLVPQERSHRSRLGWWWFAYVFATAMALYADQATLLAFVGQALWVSLLVISATRRRGLRPPWLGAWVRSAILVCLLAAPLLADVAVHGVRHSGVWAASAPDIVQMLSRLVGGQPVLLLGLAGAIGVALAAVTVWRRRRGADEHLSATPEDRSRSSATLALICWAVAPIVLVQLPGLSALFGLQSLVMAVPAICLLAGLGAASLPSRRSIAASGIGLVCVALIAVVDAPATQAPREDLRGAAMWVAARAQPGDGVVPLTPGAALAMDEYEPALVPPRTPGRMDWRTGQPGTLDSGNVATYASGRHTVFLIADVAEPQVVQVRAWFERNGYRLVAWHPEAGAFGPVVVFVYEADR